MPLLTLVAPTFAHGETYFQWRDARGGLHVSNRADRAPATADRREIETYRRPCRACSVATSFPPCRRAICSRRPVHAPIRAASSTRSFDQLARSGRLHDVDTLLVAAEPVVVEPGSDVLVARRRGAGPVNVAWSAGDALATPGAFTLVETPYVADALAERTAATEQAAVAYPAGDPCPARPPLARYAVPVARHGQPRRVRRLPAGVCLRRRHGQPRPPGRALVPRRREAVRDGCGATLRRPMPTTSGRAYPRG